MGKTSKIIIQLIIAIAIIRCQQQNSPSYNPFDSTFEVTHQRLIADSCILLSADCGYGTYGKTLENHVVYYQHSPHDENEVVAKGLIITLDTTRIFAKMLEADKAAENYDSLITVRQEQLVEETLAKSVDTLKILSVLSMYGLSYKLNFENEYDRIWCFENIQGKKYYLSQGFNYEWYNNNKQLRLIRTIQYFVSVSKKDDVYIHEED